MKLLLIGSTGMVGSRIAAEARDRGHTVTEVSRSGGEGRLAISTDDVASLAETASGHDAIVSAIAPPRDGSDASAPLVAAGHNVLDAARKADVARVLFVGGAGSLLLPDGTRNVDQAEFPAMYKGEALAHADLLDMIRSEADDLEWTNLSPAALIEPGERSGHFTLGLDDLVADADDVSRITAEDYSVALVDEIEHPAHLRQRFTLAHT